MKIEKITIKNYKSIKEMDIPMPQPKDYGGSNTVFLLGINESGKSNILEAIHKMGTGFGEEDSFQYVCNKIAQEKGQSVSVNVNAHILLDESERAAYQKMIEEDFDHIQDQITLEANLVKTVALDGNQATDELKANVKVGRDFSFDKFACANQVIYSKEELQELENPDTLPDGTPSANLENLTQSLLNKISGESIREKFEDSFPGIFFWKHIDKFLINKPITLSEYVSDVRTSPPLTNLFNKMGKKSPQEIAERIENALGTRSLEEELAQDLSSHATNLIRSAWKDHEVNIKVSISGDELEILIEDNDVQHKYYQVPQRSDGFNQFISILLTLFSEKNSILLLDEPDVHLHPSGVEFMRDEILRLGKTNTVFAATHSPSMVDTKVDKRHWIIKKSGGNTTVRDRGEHTPMLEDKVLKLAYGVEMLPALLPENLLLVEGKGDKALLEFALFNRGISVCQVGGARKMLFYANCIDSSKVNVLILLDSDKEGNKTKNEIIENYNFDKNKVLTLGDLVRLPKHSTIEDLISFDLINACLEESGHAPLTTKPSRRNEGGVLRQIRSSNPSLKLQDSKFKSALAEKAIAECSKNKEHCRLLFDLADTLVKKFQKAKKK